MNYFNIAIEKQRQCIEDLKYCKINAYKGFGKNRLLIFNGTTTYPDGDTGEIAVQKKIDDGHYLSVEDFDSYHSADIEFTDLYSGKRIDEYREKTKQNLIELGKKWRNRVLNEFSDTDITIVVHQYEGDWYLDTFNYKIDLEDGIYL